MDMTGERRIPAPRQIVWEALNNPEVLKASIPGCESLEQLADDQMKATAAVKVGPISARFTGKVQLSDINPPNSYRISGEGQGGVAGFAKGGANVALADDGGDTLLTYQVNAQVGGKLAQLGGRLIDASAKQMADAFFERFSNQVQARAPATNEPVSPGTAQPLSWSPTHPTPSPSERQPLTPEAAEVTARETWAEPVAAAMKAAPLFWSPLPREPFGLPLAAWIGGGIFVVIIVLMFGSML